MGEVKQLSVGNLVLRLFGPVCAILVAIGLFLFFSLRSIDQKNGILEGQILNELTLNNEIAGNLRLEQYEISQYLREEDGAEWKQHEQIIYNLEKTNAAKWNDYGKLVDTEMEAKLYATALEVRKKYLEATDTLLALSRANKQMEARNFALSTQAPIYEEYQRAIDEIVNWTAKESGQMATSTSALIGQTEKIGDTLIGIAVLVSIGAGIALLNITRRLKEDNIVLERAEKTLRESDEKFRQLAEAIADVFWMTSPDLQEVLYVSPAYERVWGRSVASVYAHPQEWADAILPGEREGVFALFSKLRAGMPSANAEFQIARPDGDVRWIHSRGFPVRDEAGKVTRLAGIASDITERKQAEEALRESEEKFRQLAENITDVFWITSPDLHKMYYINRAYETIWGRSAESLIAHPIQWIEAILPDDREQVMAAFATLMGDQPNVSAEYQIARPDGTTRWIHDRGFQVRDAAGALIRLAGIASDITERKRSEEMLRLLNTAVLQSKEAITITDANLDLPGPTIIFVNPAFTKMTGFTAEEAIGKTPRILQGPRTDKAVLSRLRKNLEMGEVFEGATINYRKDGQEFDLEWQIAPIREADGKITHFVALQRDITERKQLEARLFQSQKMETVGKLAGGVAHEFNSILTAIIGQSESLLGELSPDSKLVPCATEIRNAADRAATLTRQLLAYGRKQILQPEILDLNVVLAGMKDTLSHLMGRAVDLRIIPAKGLNTVKIDPEQIKQVIINIAMNAADAMPNGGNFTLETSNVILDEEYVHPFPELKPGSYSMLALTDTGVGMSEEVRARAFDPFFSTKGVGEGTGLGLATCYGILKQSNGHMSLYSEEARGTTLKIYLPQVDQSATIQLLQSKSKDSPRGTETILLAEDDPFLLKMSAAFLERQGYTVITAVNGVEALSLKNKPGVGHIDLLLTDIVMPHMSGKELADRIRATYPHTKILYTSAYTENAIVHQGVLNDGVKFLQKPFTPTALANKVREVLDQSPS